MKKRQCLCAFAICFLCAALSGCAQVKRNRAIMDNDLRALFGDEIIDEALSEYDKGVGELKDEITDHRKEILGEAAEQIADGIKNSGIGNTKAGRIAGAEDDEKTRQNIEKILNRVLDKWMGDSVDYSDWDYQPGEYFTDDRKPCRVHKSKTEKCKNYYDDGGERIKLGASQCFGFARYAQYEMYGVTSYQQGEQFKHTASLPAGKMTEKKLRELVEEAGSGAHIRTGGDQHSMIITEITEEGFSIIQCNGHNNNEYGKGRGSYEACRIGTWTYTWQEYIEDSYGKRGIDYIEYYAGD